MVKEILLTNSNKFVLVDDEDYDYLNQWNWQLVINSTSKYIGRCECINNIQQTILISREVSKRINLNLDNDIDHINQDIFDNCRRNLRSATRSQNMLNSKVRKNNTTGYKGVSFNIQHQKYRAYIMMDRKQIHLGLYIKIKDAAKAYDRAAKMLFGEYAWLNFPEEK